MPATRSATRSCWNENIACNRVPKSAPCTRRGCRDGQALSRARALGGPNDVRLVDQVLALHTDYLGAIGRMFAAIDAGNIALTKRIDSATADPDFGRIETQVFAAAEAGRRHAADQLRHLTE